MIIWVWRKESNMGKSAEHRTVGAWRSTAPAETMEDALGVNTTEHTREEKLKQWPVKC